jgi:hypothetical protein
MFLEVARSAQLSEHRGHRSEAIVGENQKMLRVTSLAALAILTLGCAREIKVATPFNPKDAEYINQRGKAKIEGQAFLRRNDGVVVYAAGSDVQLIPATSYAEERITAIYNGQKYLPIVQANLTKAPDEPGYMTLRRTTKANGEGRFVFADVAPGAYFITTNVSWCASMQYGCASQGGGLQERIQIAGQESVSVVLDGR